MLDSVTRSDIRTSARPVLSDECREVVENAISSILDAVGEDRNRSGLVETPRRVARMYDELLEGYAVDPEEILNGALFDVDYDQMVIVSGIEFYSLCEHHLLPFVGYAHVGYLPDGKVIGLSKIPRIVEMFARRLQVQERMTQQIADFLQSLVAPRGVGVVVEASHMCTVMRGIKKHHARLTTSAMVGQFLENLSTREEFMSHVRRSGERDL
jgi:GTP cyclohydrolase I